MKSNVLTRVSPVLLAIAICPTLSLATDFYVSPGGSSSGNGSISSPWDLNTACSPASAIQPGDTVWLRNGTYGSGGKTSINCHIAGNSSAPVIVRQYPGERATINQGLTIMGSYTWYWGLEVTNNNWVRSTGECGSFPSNEVPDGVYYGQGTIGVKLINMVVHDSGNGISDQQESTASEDYGNIIYNNGWASSCDRGHGHSLYMQNAGSTPKVVENNIAFNSFDIGMQAYGSAPPISHLHFIGNAIFNSGVPGGHRVDNFLVTGGSQPKQDIVFQGNVAYNPLDAAPAESGYNQIGDGGGVDVTLQNNYWIGAPSSGYWALFVTGWQSTTFTGNTVVGPLIANNDGFSNWSGNTYYSSHPPSGVDSGSTVVSGSPTGVKVLVEPNKYEPGRANIIVMNWDKSSTVTVDLSNSGLPTGTPFEIRDAQNFYGSPVLTGTYNGGTVVLPMNLTAVSQGVNFTAPAHTSAEFGVFVLLPTGTVSGSGSGSDSGSGSTPPPASVAVSVSPSTASLNAGDTKQFTASVTGSSNTAVTWSLSSSVGSISSTGLYTAPASVSSQQSVKVIATSQADNTQSASATITVDPTSTPAPPPTTSGAEVGFWSFDTADTQSSVATDSSGNSLNGVMSNVTSVAGKVNEALSFNGTNSVVSIPFSPKYQLQNSLTVSAWIQTTNTTRTEDFLGNYDANAMEWGYILKTLPSGVVGLRVGGNNVSGSRDVADTTKINDGKWHHVAVVINLGKDVQFYVDGTLSSTQPMATVAAGNSAPLWIGTLPFNYFGMPFTGSLDSVRIDNQALDAASIAQIAGTSGSGSTGGTGSTSGGSVSSAADGSALFWSFDSADLTGSQIEDASSDGLNGQVSGTTVTDGHMNQAFAFNGSNSLVTVGDNPKLDLTNSMTLSAWIKTTNSSRVEDFLGKYDATGLELGYMLETLPSGVVDLRIGGLNVAGTRDAADTTKINDGNWHHVAVVINMGQNVQFYIDGKLSSTHSMATNARTTAAAFWVGTPPFPYFGAPFTGSLDDIRVDNQALSAPSIAQLASL